MIKYDGYSYENASKRIQEIVEKCAKVGACTDDEILELYELRAIRIIRSLTK